MNQSAVRGQLSKQHPPPCLGARVFHYQRSRTLLAKIICSQENHQRIHKSPFFLKKVSHAFSNKLIVKCSIGSKSLNRCKKVGVKFSDLFH